MDHCQEADLVVVCDTGSTDGTLERLKERGAVVYSIFQKPWRFDVARNTALSLVPSDIDLCISLDLDEVIQPGWSNALDQVWQEYRGNVNRLTYDFVWSWMSDGKTPDVRFNSDKIHRREGYRWKYPCHETLYYEGLTTEVRVHVPKISIHHHADTSKSRSQYLDLLKLAVEEDPKNDRMCHYYARELMFNAKYDDAIKEFQRHLALPTSTWREERAASLRYISRCYRSLGQLKNSQDAAVRAVLEWDQSREPWLELCRSAHANHDWQTVYWAGTKCLNIKERAMSYISDSVCWGSEPYDHLAVAAYNIGLYSNSVEYGKLALELDPNDERLKSNLEYYLEKQAIT